MSDAQNEKLNRYSEMSTYRQNPKPFDENVCSKYY